MKLTCRAYIHCYFKCAWCGKEYEGEQTKEERKFLIHLLIRHPVRSIRYYLDGKWRGNRVGEGEKE